MGVELHRLDRYAEAHEQFMLAMENRDSVPSGGLGVLYRYFATNLKRHFIDGILLENTVI